MSYDTELRTTRQVIANLTIIDGMKTFAKNKNNHLKIMEKTFLLVVSESDVETLSNIAEEVKNLQNLSNKDVYVNFQSLIENLKHYQSKDLSRLGLNDESSLLSHKELGNLILQDFKKTFEHIFQNFNHDFKIENLPEIPIALHTIDWLALSELDKHNILPNLFKNEKVIEVLDWYISSQIIHKRGYIEIFKTDEIQDHLLKHQDLGDIRNLLNCAYFLELGFIRAHMDSLLKMKNTRANFEEILKAMEEAPSFNPNWLKVLNMDSVEKDLPAFYGEKEDLYLNRFSTIALYFKIAVIGNEKFLTW
ncbi:hypothetical protein BY996DRAFT_6454251 [Phakopsora pachyrhizi]|nr:hypothetical protein BY996DRAFT_6454251 [Phakopsora pachyrhizi]